MAFAQATDAVCAEVRIVIEQKLSLERQAFDARMVITNGLADQKLENVSITLQFLDANNSVVTATTDPAASGASFFYRTDGVEGITSLEGGTIAPKAVANVRWLIIPAAGTGGRDPQGTLYYIGAKVSYTLDGKTDTVDVAPESIVVRPQPELVLDYFLPRDVAGDDAFTPEVEPSDPFTLGVRIRNSGGGISYRTRIDTAQPRIVENRQGLLVNFQILSGYVDDAPAGKSLLLDFGDIAPGSSRHGRWNMVSSLAGKFVEFTAGFTHADSLGGALTSLIKAVNTHQLVRDVRVDLPGRDKVRDFLAKDGDIHRVYESDGVDTEVSDQSRSAQFTPSGATAGLQFNPVANGMAYARVPDPFKGARVPHQVVRSDGYVVPSENVWLSRERNEDLGWSHYLHLFDVNTTGRYTIGLVAGEAQASIAGAAFDDRNANGLRDAGEPGIPVLEIKLTGTRAGTGESVLATAHTDAQGQFRFEGLLPGSYALSAAVSEGLVDGAALAGTAGGQAAPGRISGIDLATGTAGAGYLFAKRSAKAAGPDPEPEADLGITVTAAPATIAPGGTSTVTITARNAGPAVAAAAVVHLDLPQGLEIASQSAAAGSYAQGRWTLGGLAKDASSTLTLQVRPQSASSAREFLLAVRIGAATRDPVTSNNTASTLLRREQEAGVTASQTMDQGLRVLAYASCGADTACTDRKRQALQDLLAPADGSVQITATAQALRRALRAGDFSVLWLHGPVEELEASLLEEARAAVYRGASLVMEGAPGASMASLADAWGGSHAGRPLPAGAALQLGAETLALQGEAWALQATGTTGAVTELAHYGTGQAAALGAMYGRGRTLVMGFDALAQSGMAAAWKDWTQARFMALVPPVSEPMLAQSAVRISTRISNRSAQAVALEQAMALANGMQLRFSSPPATVQGSQARWALEPASRAEVDVLAWLSLPGASLATTVETQLRKAGGTSLVDSWSQPLSVIAAPQAASNTVAAVAALAQATAGQRHPIEALLAQARAFMDQQKPAQALAALVQAQPLLRALPIHGTREAALQHLAQWMGLAAAQWRDEAPKDWVLSIVAGDLQAARLEQAFALPLQVRLGTANGDPVAGEEVVFSAPASGASVRFAGGSRQWRVLTDAQGMARTPALTATGAAGRFSISAGVDALPGGVRFTLDNLDGSASVLRIVKLAGDGQAATVGMPYAQPVRVKVIDAQGAAVAGHAVGFALPDSGASAVFDGGLLAAQTVTDAAGVAVSPALRANGLAGAFEMRVTAAGVGEALRVTLQNQAAPAGGKDVALPTPTGSGTLKASVAGGGASCRFNPDRTAVRKPEGWLPLLNVLFFPHGVFDYELTGCDVGSTVTVTTEWPNLFGISSYLKYGPMPHSQGRSLWYAPRNLSINGNRISYTITDGQLGDDDLQANGVIKDPGGPVIQSGPLPEDLLTAVPGLEAAGLALLSALMALGACLQHRRRRAARAGAGMDA
jgi:uncharacterized repeat protein (TIGR01451 family)